MMMNSRLTLSELLFKRTTYVEINTYLCVSGVDTKTRGEILNMLHRLAVIPRGRMRDEVELVVLPQFGLPFDAESIQDVSALEIFASARDLFGSGADLTDAEFGALFPESGLGESSDGDDLSDEVDDRIFGEIPVPEVTLEDWVAENTELDVDELEPTLQVYVRLGSVEGDLVFADELPLDSLLGAFVNEESLRKLGYQQFIVAVLLFLHKQLSNTMFVRPLRVETVFSRYSGFARVRETSFRLKDFEAELNPGSPEDWDVTFKDVFTGK